MKSMSITRINKLTRTVLLLGAVLMVPSAGWAVSFNEAQTATNDAGDTIIPLAAQNLATGALNIACFKWETPAVSINSVTDTAGNTYTLLTEQTHTGNEPHIRCAYVLSATGNAANVVTANLNGTGLYRRGVVYEFTYTGTAAFDVEVGSTEATADTTPSSNTLTTTGTEEVCIAAHSDFTGQTFSGHTINGVAADGSTNLSDAAYWYKIFSATFTGGASSLTRTATGNWLQRLQCFKITGGGGGGTARNLMLMGVGQ